MIIWPAKRQDETLDYSWNPPLENGEHISTHTVTLISGSAVINSTTHNNSTVTAWLSNGAVDSVFELTAATTQGRIYQTTSVIQVAPEHDTDIASFLAIFPSFSGVPDATLAFWIARGQGQIDDSWSSQDNDFAGYLLAAHYMTLNGLGTGTESDMANNGATGMTKLKSGAFEVAFDSASASKGAYSGTRFGRQFYEILKRNKLGALITNAGF